MFQKKKKPPSPLAEMRRLRPDSEKSDHRTVSKHENDIAEVIDGRAVGTKGSRGAGHKRADARSNKYEVECKQTANKSISLKMEWLLDISRLALGKGLKPLLSLRFLKREMEVEQDWVLIPMSEFKRLIELDGQSREEFANG